jgi:hypothetical protein
MCVCLCLSLSIVRNLTNWHRLRAFLCLPPLQNKNPQREKKLTCFLLDWKLIATEKSRWPLLQTKAATRIAQALGARQARNLRDQRAKAKKGKREKKGQEAAPTHARTHARSWSLLLVSEPEQSTVRSEWKHVTLQLARVGTAHQPITRLLCVLTFSYSPMETLRLVWLIGLLPTIEIPFHTYTPGVLKLLTSLRKSMISVFLFTLRDGGRVGEGNLWFFRLLSALGPGEQLLRCLISHLGNRRFCLVSHWGTTGMCNFRTREQLVFYFLLS